MLNNKILRAKTAYIIKAVVLISLFFASVEQTFSDLPLIIGLCI